MKKVEEKNLFQNVRTGKESLFSREHFLMSELCQGFLYDDCPVKKRVEEDKFEGCADWMREHWEEGLELLGWKKMGSVKENKGGKMMKVKNTETGNVVEINPENIMVTQLCYGKACTDCPLKNHDCTGWAREHLDEALKMFGFEKVEDVKQEDEWGNEQETSESNSGLEPNYFLMRHLGVGYRERFQIEGTDGVYYVGVAGRLFRVYDKEGSRKREIENGQVLYTLLEYPERVRKIGLTKEHREYLEAVLKVLPEVQWVKRDGGWLLFGKENVVLLAREKEGWEELKDGKERDVRELLGK